MKVQPKGTSPYSMPQQKFWDEETADCLNAIVEGMEVVCDHIIVKKDANFSNNKAAWRARIASMCLQMGEPMVSTRWSPRGKSGRFVLVISR